MILSPLIVEILMPGFIYILAPGFKGNEEKIELTIYLTRLTFPFLIFVSLASFFSAILNSHNKFAVAAGAPIILNILLISVLIYGKYLNDDLVVYLSYAVSLAGLIQLIILIIFSRISLALRTSLPFPLTVFAPIAFANECIDLPFGCLTFRGL